MEKREVENENGNRLIYYEFDDDERDDVDEDKTEV